MTTSEILDETTTSVDSPGPNAQSSRPSRTQLKWTPQMEVAFIAAMKNMQCAPTKSAPSGFTKDAYKRVIQTVKEKSVQPELCDEVRMKNKLGSLRNDWRTWVNLLNTGWQRLPNGCPTNTDEVLEHYYRDTDPNARKFRTAPLKYFTELTDLFDPNRNEIDDAADRFAQSIHSLLAEQERTQASRQTDTPQTPDESANLQNRSRDSLEREGLHAATAFEESLPTSARGSHALPNHGVDSARSAGKRPAEDSASGQAKRPSFAAIDSYFRSSRTLDILKRQSIKRDNLSPVAAATALFTHAFRSLPVEARVAVVQRFQDQNLAEIFFHSDAEVQKALVDTWIREAGVRT